MRILDRLTRRRPPATQPAPSSTAGGVPLLPGDLTDDEVAAVAMHLAARGHGRGGERSCLYSAQELEDAVAAVRAAATDDPGR